MFKYEIIIYWSNEDSAFIAEIPELPGCMAHGPTPEKALKNAKDAIRLWMDTAKEFGDPIPQPKGERLIFALTGKAPVRRGGARAQLELMGSVGDLTCGTPGKMPDQET
jgi:predicted RNase H-like HicB family nuclease